MTRDEVNQLNEPAVKAYVGRTQPYLFVEETLAVSFLREVNLLISEGYEPVGGMNTVLGPDGYGSKTAYYYQAMYRPIGK